MGQLIADAMNTMNNVSCNAFPFPFPGSRSVGKIKKAGGQRAVSVMNGIWERKCILFTPFVLKVYYFSGRGWIFLFFVTDFRLKISRELLLSLK